MTQDNVGNALAGESQAHIKYLAFSEKAAAEDLPNVARIFKAASYSEQVHATNHLKTLAGVGGTKENLAAAAAGENFEVEEMYPAYLAVAQAQ
ncbi:MAG TPA: rubrerythrin family protein, partial [Burkholderiales bacterium]|nr:rubrerythrin family protein [Burkholderiales bacterium]